MKSIILWSSFFLTVYSETYNCTSDSYTVQLPPHKIAFFNSKNLLNASDSYNCDITFVSTVENVRCYVFYRAWRGFNPYYDSPTFLLLNNSKFSTYGDIENPLNVQYLEGTIIFDQWDDSCLLESISETDPFLFEDENQVLYINNTFNGTHASSHPCKWKFKAPEGYGFKIIVQVYETGSGSHLIIENRTEVLINENSVKLNHPIYNSDTYIQIYLNNPWPNLKFLGIVSIVQRNVDKTNGSCFFGISESWNLHPELGFYGNNEICTMEYSIMPYTEILVSYYLNLGDVADYVGYYDTDNNLMKLDPHADDKHFMLASYPNNTIRNISWSFISDGSIPGFSFDIGFDVIACNCVTVIPCPGGGTLIDDNDVYCSNLECELIIESCSSNYTFFEMSMFAATRITTLDIFQIYSNDILVYETYFSSTNQRDHYMFLKSANKNVLKVHTFYWNHLQPRSLMFNSRSFEMPSISDRVLLSHQNPSYVIDTRIHSLTYVEISDEMKFNNYMFEIHRSYLNDIYLYNNNNFTVQVNESCDTTKSNIRHYLDDFLYTCTIKSYKKFLILKSSIFSDESVNPYVVIQLLKTKRNCVFDTKVFQQNVIPSLTPHINVLENVTISTISTQNEPCIITYVTQRYSPPHIVVSTMTKVWTTSKYENVTIFIGGNQSKILFTFNYETQDSWHDIVLAANVYTIQIPKNSSVFMIVSYLPVNTMFSESDKYSYDTTLVKISHFPYHSIATNACYGTTKFYACYSPTEILHQTFIIENVTVKFTAKYLNLPKQLQTSMRSNSTGELYIFHNANDYFIFRNEVVVFGFSNISYTANYSIYDDNNGVLLFIEAL